jgi:RimJ/RimL family protein N-acetyltransferase
MAPGPSEPSDPHDADGVRLRADELRREDYPAREFLRTRRMLLREFGYRHMIDLLALGREERITRWLLDGPLRTPADVVALVVAANRLYVEQPGLGYWHASSREQGFIGLFSLTPQPGSAAVGIGARLLPRAWGGGYALEGGAALCEHAFATVQAGAVVGLCDPRNRSVPPLLTRLGFLADGQGEQFGKPALRFVLRREHWRGARSRRDRRDQGGAGE